MSLTEERKMERKTDFIVNHFGIDWETYQLNFFLSKYKKEAILKSRQVGLSFCASADALASATLLGEKFLVISYSQDEAAEKIDYARTFLRNIKNPPFELPKLVADAVHMLKFDNGGEFKSVPARSVRGRSKNILCDEFEYYRNQREVYRAITPSTIREDDVLRRLKVFSTPLTSDGMFATMFREQKKSGKESGYHLVKVYWWESKALCKDIVRAKIEAPLMTTYERVQEFGTDSLISEFEDGNRTEDEFKLEFECEFDAMGGNDLIKLDDLMNCVNDDYPYVHYHGANSTFKCNEPINIGIDIGRKNHGTELVICNRENRVLAVISLNNITFSTQKIVIGSVIKNNQVEKVKIDGTGLGMNIAEDLNKEFGNVIETVEFTAKIKDFLATTLKRLVETEKIEVPFDKLLISQILSLKREINDKGTATYYVKKEAGEKHHADMFFALALAVTAGTNELHGEILQSIYQEVGRISGNRKIGIRRYGLF